MQKKAEKGQRKTDMQKITLLAFALVLLAVLGYLFLQLRQDTNDVEAMQPVQPTVTNAVQTEMPKQTDASNSVLVEIKGAVYNPGTYTLTKGQTVADALMLAGGPTDRAILDEEFMGQIINEDMTIQIPEQ